jgi:hypothetical protein
MTQLNHGWEEFIHEKFDLEPCFGFACSRLR